MASKDKKKGGEEKKPSTPAAAPTFGAKTEGATKTARSWSEIVKNTLWILAVGITVTMILRGGNCRNLRPQDQAGGAGGNTAAAPQNRPVVPAMALPVLQDGIVQDGLVHVRVYRGQKFEVGIGPGESVIIDRRQAVAHDRYANGRVIAHVPVGPAGGIAQSEIVDTNLVSYGAGLPADSPAEYLDFAVVKYRGPDPDKSWREVAFTLPLFVAR